MKIGFIGAGQMARALAGGIVGSRICKAEDITISDPNEDSIAAFVRSVGNAKIADDNVQCSVQQDLVFFAVKPQYFETASDGIDLSGSEATVVSVMSGIQMMSIANALNTQQIIRVMPNTPCLVGAGACGMSVAAEVDDSVSRQVHEMLASLGKVVHVNENQLDAVTGLSGSGPAYVFTFIEALADGGVLMGLSRADALVLATQTVFGAAQMILETGDHPAVLRDRVASPGGTTIRGIQALENGGFRAAVLDAVQNATERSLELGDH